MSHFSKMRIEKTIIDIDEQSIDTWVKQTLKPYVSYKITVIIDGTVEDE